jgi:hypothetical protein
MVPVNHKCTIIDIGLDLILQLFKGQCEKQHYFQKCGGRYGEVLFLRIVWRSQVSV